MKRFYKSNWFIVKTVCLFLIAGLLICCGGCQENSSVTSSDDPIVFPSGIAYDEGKDILLQGRLYPESIKINHIEDAPDQPIFEKILSASTHIVKAKYLGCVYRDQTQKQFKGEYECWFDLQEMVCGETIDQRFCFKWKPSIFSASFSDDTTMFDPSRAGLTNLEIGQTYLLFLAEKQSVFYDDPYYSLVAQTFFDLRLSPQSGYSYGRKIKGITITVSWDEFWALIDRGWSPATELTTSNIGAYLKTNDLSEIIAGSPEIRRLKILERQKDLPRNTFENTQLYTVEIVSDFKSEFPLDRKTVTVPAGSVEVGKEYIMMFANKEFTDPYGNKYENRDLSSKHSIRPISEEETIRKIIAQQAAEKAETSQ